MSQNIMVNCLRSASYGGEEAEWDAVLCSTRLLDDDPSRLFFRSAIAASSLRRCPTDTTPIAVKSSAVKSSRTSASMSLSRNAPSYRSSLRSRQPPANVHRRFLRLPPQPGFQSRYGVSLPMIRTDLTKTLRQV